MVERTSCALKNSNYLSKNATLFCLQQYEFPSKLKGIDPDFMYISNFIINEIKVEQNKFYAASWLVGYGNIMFEPLGKYFYHPST